MLLVVYCAARVRENSAPFDFPDLPSRSLFQMPSRRDLANAIRALSMDAVQQANSGHPGAPMGMERLPGTQPG
jgi:hypothetical protein